MNKSDFFTPGKKVFIRTVTFHQVGEVKTCGDDFIILKNASWVADSGRFNNALTTGELDEIEPIPGDTYVSTSAIIDAMNWDHDLPAKVK